MEITLDKQIRNFILFAIVLDLIVGAVIGQFLPLQETTIKTELLAVFVSGVIAFVILQISHTSLLKSGLMSTNYGLSLLFPGKLFFSGLF